MNFTREELIALIPYLQQSARNLTQGNITEAEDLVQDTLLRALSNENQFENGTNLKAWLTIIMRNRFITWKSLRYRIREIHDDFWMQNFPIESEQMIKLQYKIFVEGFQRLPKERQKLLLLHTVHGLTYEELGQIYNCPVTAIKSRLNRARTQLKKILAIGWVRN